MVRISWRTRLSERSDNRAGRDRFSTSRKSRNPRSVPGYDGFRLDDNQRGTPVAPSYAQPRPKESIGRSEFRLLHRPMQDAKLVAKCEILHLESGSRFEEREGNAAHQTNGVKSETEATTGGKHAPYSHVVRNLRQAQLCNIACG